jgi:hypothetical protein
MTNLLPCGGLHQGALPRALLRAERHAEILAALYPELASPITNWPE